MNGTDIVFSADSMYDDKKWRPKAGKTVDKYCFETFVGLTNTAMKSIQRLKVQKMKKYSLTSAHTNCICRLETAGKEGLTQTDLVRQEMMDPSQISRVLRELGAKGYVQLSGEEGRYRRRYSLTSIGEEIAVEIRSIVEEIHDFVIQDIPLEDIEAFYRTYEAICAGLERAEAHHLKPNE